MFIMMNKARLAVGMEGLALSERAYQHALQYAKDRVQGTDAGVARRSEGRHPAPRRRAPPADEHEEQDRGDARARLRASAPPSIKAPTTPDEAGACADQLVDLLIPLVKG